ncbi:PREDICTED: uncharacterized protein LOC109590773, partial [Amphimedon queenslandica]|uniref:Uncharacterized protein n=1 Tax=Amphimedon queenslandica TaxID=400682 RepID=A0AAN0JYB1_AMPQE
RGGEFKADSWYGSIQRKKFCLVAIVGVKCLPKSSTNGDESEEEEEQLEEEAEEEVEDGNSDSSSDSDKTKGPPGGNSGGQGESTSNEGVEEEGETGGEPLHEEGNEEQNNVRVEESKDHEEPQHEEATAPIPCTEISSDFNSEMVISTGVVENMTYAGQVYYEEKRTRELVTFTAAKKLSALIEFIEKKHIQAEIDQHVYFSFNSSYSYIELKSDAPQEEPFTGWSIKPHLKPCRLRRCDIDNFGDANYPVPPSCLISIYGSPGAVPSLHYSVPLVGVVDPVTLLIHCSLRTAPPRPSINPNSSMASNESAVLSTGGAIHMINTAVRQAPSMEECIDEFKASLSFKRKLPQVQEHCQKFLDSFIAVRGSYAHAAIALGEDLIETIRNELGFEFIIDIDA